jgi:hypothetical protein
VFGVGCASSRLGEVTPRIVPENQRELNPHCPVIKETVDYQMVLN